LTPEQESQKRELQDELNKVAPHLVSIDTVRRFKNREAIKVENTLRRIRHERSTYSPTEGIATGAAVQRLRDNAKARVEERAASITEFVQTSIVRILTSDALLGVKTTLGSKELYPTDWMCNTSSISPKRHTSASLVAWSQSLQPRTINSRSRKTQSRTITTSYNAGTMVWKANIRHSKVKHTMLTWQYVFLENANRSIALDGKTKLAEQKFASSKELKKQATESQRGKEALELRVATLEEVLARIQAAGSRDQQSTDITDSDAFGRLSVSDNIIHDAGEEDILVDNEKDFGNNAGGKDVVISNNASDEVTSPGSDRDEDEDTHDLLSNISAENEDAQETTLTSTERLRLSVDNLQLSFQISTKAITNTIFVVAVKSQWKDPDPTTARDITNTMVTISNETRERVKRWPTALKNVEDTYITKLWMPWFLQATKAWESDGQFEIFEEWETTLRDKLQKQTLACTPKKAVYKKLLITETLYNYSLKSNRDDCKFGSSHLPSCLASL
jgi:hypothetical protein